MTHFALGPAIGCSRIADRILRRFDRSHVRLYRRGELVG